VTAVAAPAAAATAADATLADELIGMALKGADDAMLCVCRLGDRLSSDERHQIRAALTPVRGCLLTLRRLQHPTLASEEAAQ